MTYEEAITGQPVTKREAIREYEKHGHSAEELYVDLGNRDEYNSKEILTVLGY